MLFPAALDIVRKRVKPDRDRNADKGFRESWWRFGRPRGEMRDALVLLSRYIAGNRIGKRFLYCWAEPSTCPSDLTVVFAFEHDYAMGILTSSVHRPGPMRSRPRFESIADTRPTSCFETFPWPQPSEGIRHEIANVAERLIDRRQAICVERGIGLTDFYNQLDEGAWRDVAGLHRELDGAVARAYGWPASVAADRLEVRARLAKLHGEITRSEIDYEPFG